MRWKDGPNPKELWSYKKRETPDLCTYKEESCEDIEGKWCSASQEEKPPHKDPTLLGHFILDFHIQNYKNECLLLKSHSMCGTPNWIILSEAWSLCIFCQPLMWLLAMFLASDSECGCLKWPESASYYKDCQTGHQLYLASAEYIWR